MEQGDEGLRLLVDQGKLRLALTQPCPLLLLLRAQTFDGQEKPPAHFTGSRNFLFQGLWLCCLVSARFCFHPCLLAQLREIGGHD